MVKCKSKNVIFSMDLGSTYSKDIKIMDNIQRKLEAAGFKVSRPTGNKGVGPNAMASAYTYCYNHGIKNSIIFNLMNGVDPSNIREAFQQDSNDGSGYWYSRKALKPLGNVAVLGWFYGACDCVHPGGSCYNSVRGSETSRRLYNPKQVMDNNGVLCLCEKTDYTGDKVAEAFIKLVNENMGEVVPDTETVNPNNDTTADSTESTSDTSKTLTEQTIVETYTNAYFQHVYAVNTDENGMFEIPLPLPLAGKYAVNANFAGNKDYEPYTVSSELEHYAGDVFQAELLETVTTNKYSDGSSDSNVKGNKAGKEHTMTKTTVHTYKDGSISDTKETVTNNDDVTTTTPSSVPAPSSTQESSASTSHTGEFKDPFATVVAMNGDKPNVAVMKHNNKTFEMVDLTKTYNLTKDMYTAVFYRDSKSIQLNNYLESKFTAFECTNDNKFHVIERERWNVIEESIYYYRVLADHKYGTLDDPKYPNEIIIDFPNKRTKMGTAGWTKWKAEKSTYHFCADAQDTGYTCGPTSCSVCTQVLHKFYHEREMQSLINAIAGYGSGPGSHQSALKSLGFTAEQYTSDTDVAVAWLKTNRPTVMHYDGHYVAFVDITEDGKKILIANSSTGSHAPLTGWRDVSRIHYNSDGYWKRYVNTTVKVGLNWNITDEEKTRLNNFYKSMGGTWPRTANTNETIRRSGFW